LFVFVVEFFCTVAFPFFCFVFFFLSNTKYSLFLNSNFNTIIARFRLNDIF